MIAIIDYDIGNLAAVSNMFHRLGHASQITSDAKLIAQADRIVLPGNGAFDACMRNLRATGLIPLLQERVLRQRIPLLGICVGAQMLGHGSEEGAEPGLGWIDMRVRRFESSTQFRVPHMGWNQVVTPLPDHPIGATIQADTRFYFVHSYYMQLADSKNLLLSANYGIDFTAGVVHENMVGVQFHPEKSHSYGKRLLAAFAKD